MNSNYEDQRSFITDWGLYCYSAMPLGLKNSRDTNRGLGNCMFKEQIERNMDVYVDDLLVKSGNPEQHLDDL